MNIITEFGQRAPDSNASAAQQLVWGNAGALKVSTDLGLLRTSGNISTISGTSSYDLLTSFSSFQKIDFDGGVHFYDGTNYKPMKPVTENWLDTYIPYWRNESTGNPSAYYKKGDKLNVFPTPSTSWTNGILVNYFTKPTTITADGDDPFDDGSTRGDLSSLHEGVVLYMIWKAKESIGEYQQAEIARLQFVSFMRDAEVWANKDEEAVGDPFRPYHKGSPIYYGDPNFWGKLS